MKKIFFALLITLTLFGCSDRVRNEEVLKVGVLTWAGVGPGYVGIEKRYFNDISVEMVVIDDSKARHAAFMSGDIDIMITNIDQHPREIVSGLNGKLILVSDISNGADGIVSNKSIASVSQLKGKKIAYTTGTTSDWLLFNLLDKNNVSTSDVNLIQMDDLGNATSALISGDVDAAVSWEPLMTQSVISGKTNIIATSRDVPGKIVGVFIAQEKIYKNKVILKAFLDGWFKSVDAIKNNKIETYPIMAKGLNVSENELEGMLGGVILANLELNRSFFVEKINEIPMVGLLNEASNYWLSKGILKETPKAKDSIPKYVSDYYENSK